MSVIHDVQSQVDKRARAMVDADIGTIADLLDERLLYTHSSGLTDTRDSYVAALNRQEYTYHSVKTVSLDHSIEIGGLVILNSLMEASMTVKSSGQTVSRQLKVTEVWVPGDAGYRLLVSNSTNIAA
jgi:hypothetical protein